MEGRRTHHSSIRSLLLNPFFLLLALLWSAAPICVVHGLNIGVQHVNSGGILASKKECSRKCESAHCTVPPFLRYGKYCGILYSGCPGEEPCDALDACCKLHDDCIQNNHDYLSQECSQKLLNCMAAVKESKMRSTFKGNNCTVEEVVNVVTVVIEAALVAGKILHKP